MRLRIRIATLLLVLLAFNSGIRLAKKSIFFDRQKIPTDAATLQENRLQGLKDSLPKRGIVGFVQETTLPFVEKLRKYFLTQYVLTPLIVVENSDQELLIANFSKDTDFKEWLQGKPFRVLKDLNNGVALLKHPTK